MKIICLAYIMTFALFLGFLPIGNVHAANEDLSYFEVIEIADPYIIKDGIYYEISNKDKLNNLLGNLYFEKVVVQVENANNEISNAAGISFIPGFGAATTVAGAVVGLISWADARTWSTASSLITSKIESQKYYLTIDINAWNMDVQVYVS